MQILFIKAWACLTLILSFLSFHQALTSIHKEVAHLGDFIRKEVEDCQYQWLATTWYLLENINQKVHFVSLSYDKVASADPEGKKTTFINKLPGTPEIFSNTNISEQHHGKKFNTLC